MFLRAGEYVLIFLATYYFASLIQIIFHRIFGHTHRINRLYDIHFGGHHAQYSENLVSENWIPTEQHITWYYAIPFLPMAVAAFYFLPFDLFVSYACGLTFAIWWHIYLHRQYHIRNSWLIRFSWFQKKRLLHFLHHQQSRKNYAIVEYFWDRLFGTYKEIRNDF
jgi:sterol desaturase/sphingolipid hydroxylase (fatty acid hydroxylase superfamily)